ncbi:MAG: ABC transporter substrate-binding protein [Clostridia bacterium]|nr:ABC transporter substrate-binding protein [Clostridia bacterium]
MKKTVSVLLAILLLLPAFCLISCQEQKPTVAIIQFGSHASLNNCYDGIMAGLAAGGTDLSAYRVERVNSNFDSSLSKSQANSFVNGKAAVIIAIATPSAVSAATAADGEIPVVFCAVTDASVMSRFENVTGSSDIPDFNEQLKTVTAFLGKSEVNVGVLFSTEEPGSPFQLAELKKAAASFPGMTVTDSAVADINTIDTKVEELLNRGVDCLINLLDNTVVGKLESNILPITDERGIPVFGSEIEQVKVGCLAGASIEYLDVGKVAGLAAARILAGERAGDIPVATVTQPTVYFNSSVARRLSITVPQENYTDVVR